MASKYQNILQLEEFVARDITTNSEKYTSFLTTAANNFKYSFEEQLLIYAQKPNATACAEISFWNKYGRWVNKGAKGIALLVDTDAPYKLRHVFDISDTNIRKNIEIPMWKMQKHYENEVLEGLANSFGEFESTDFVDGIIKTADIVTQDNIDDYFVDLIDNKNDSLLEEVDEVNLNSWFKTTVSNSIAFMVLTRCGYNAHAYFMPEDFEHIGEFSTPFTISILGNAVSDVSEMVLRDIAKTVSSLQKAEKQQNHTVEQIQPKDYYNVTEEKAERSEQNGDYLQDAGGLSNSKSEPARQSEDRQIWNDEKNISDESPQGDLHRNETFGNSEQPLGGNRSAGEPDGRGYNQPDGTERASERTTETGKSDALGSENEQLSSDSRGNSVKSADLQLNNEQAEVDNTSAFSISEQDIFNVLINGSNFSNGKLRIYEQYLKNEPDNSEFLKNEYGIGGVYPLIREEKISVNYDSKGIEIQKKIPDNQPLKLLLSWKQVDKRLKNIINEGKYFTESEKQKLNIKTQPEIIQETAQDAQISLDIESLQQQTIGQDIEIVEPKPPDVVCNQFKITDDDLGVGTKSERYANNINAIKTLKQIEGEQRLATPAEQEILSKYVGWGGLADYFDDKNPKYLELKSLMTEEEYSDARESTLTAFYTPPIVIKAMYKALENLGFEKGNILEPACGTGNFLGLLPDSMQKSKCYGVELDDISGRIAKQLYQNSDISINGFEKNTFPDSFFDVAVGNVPFGNFQIADKRYDKYKFMVHDYFFARTLDQVRAGGIVAFITSKGTMDKENPAVRKYIAQRADLLGAIRLPNNTFKSAAGTEVTSDILFLQKRDSIIDIEPDWVHLNTNEKGIKMNQYFVDHPDMILGEMLEITGQYGMETACVPYENEPLDELLNVAVQNITGSIWEYDFDDLTDSEQDTAIPADPTVKNFSYTVVDGQIYYRENSKMNKIDLSETAQNRIKGMIEIRDCVRTLIEYQTEDYSDEQITQKQQELNKLYDDFSKKYGLINSRANNSAFRADSSYFLLCSLEVLDDEGNFRRKADMFSKRTIKQKVSISKVDTASEALALYLAEKAGIDIDYMSNLTGKSEEQLADDLKNVIFLNPHYSLGQAKYLTADEYLSGNVREKLKIAREYADKSPEEYSVNVAALEKVQPVDLTASEISLRLGSTWIPPEYIRVFMFDLLDTPPYMKPNIKVHYSAYTGAWNVEGKSYDRTSIKAYTTYGTSRINAYKIIEETLNLKDVRIFDYVIDEDGRKTPVLNKKETAIAQGKQQLIKQAFTDWIWKEPNRREQLCKLYNEKFNSIRPREYDGSHLHFVGINPEITLRPHQINAIAHVLYGGNTLLAHVVGGGKTFEMVASAQESKRLGLCQKSLFVVPNHLTEQWATEYLQLYPSANILVATKKDFETKNRKKFCGRIATGDYDAVIIGHSQLEKIPMSIERQRKILEEQLEEIMDGIAELKRNRGDNFSVKQLERTKKMVKSKLDKLNDQSRKDDVVTFEELGIDRLFVDEAHYYKNLAAFTKMRNVGGISQTEAQKSSDLYMKCRYLDEITGGKGIIFATGTPISNSMVEMYTMQKYLQYNTLKSNGLLHFDAWASTFGETVTAIELSPEGTGYRAKTRFAKFYNLPELMSMFKEVADIKTADMLNLPVPKAEYKNVVLKPSEHQKEMVASLSERAERVRNKMVDSSVDNMLLITNDGRKLALDQRLINPMLPQSENGKTSACADNVYEIWKKTADKRSTQMIFCDLSTPKANNKDGENSFNVYDDIKLKLIEKGIPSEEISFIHSASTEAQKKELFGKVRSGQIRILLGSTAKMGAGTNCQKKLIALHHLECPWRPADLQQREGRIIRQGNENKEVQIYTYVTENTFDSYLYQLVESKQKFIGQIMTSKSPVRAAEDIDETALSYAEIKALCTGNQYIKEKMDLDIDVQRLKLLKSNHLSQKYSLEDQIIKEFPQKIAFLEQRINGFESDIKHLSENTHKNEDGFSPMQIEGKLYTDKKAAGSAILEVCKAKTSPEPIPIGEYRGFKMELLFEVMTRTFQLTLQHDLKHRVTLGNDVFGNIQRIDNMLDSFADRKAESIGQLENVKTQLEYAKQEVDKPFIYEEELQTKSNRLEELNIMLNMDKNEPEIVDSEPDEENNRSNRDYER